MDFTEGVRNFRVVGDPSVKGLATPDSLALLDHFFSFIFEYKRKKVV